MRTLLKCINLLYEVYYNMKSIIIKLKITLFKIKNHGFRFVFVQNNNSSESKLTEQVQLTCLVFNKKLSLRTK